MPSFNRRGGDTARPNGLEQVANPKASGRILIIADEIGAAERLGRLIHDAGYCTEVVSDGESAVLLARSAGFDVILVDGGLPHSDGCSVCSTLRRSGVDTPIVVLSGNSDTQHKIRAFELGADDFMVKPFVIEELLARIAVLLRRYRINRRQSMTQFQVGEMHIDFLRSSVLRSGVPISFSAKELQLLRYLIERRNCVVSRESLLKDVWGYVSTDTRTVDVHIATIRQKLEEDPQQPRHIVTLRRKGYMFVD